MHIFGLKNCDTCRKAVKWLKSRDRAFTFTDVKIEGVTRGQVSDWVAKTGWEMILNRRSTTWRTLDADEKKNITEEKAIDLMVQYPTLIKRPVFVMDPHVVVGFGQKEQAVLEGHPS